MLSHTWMRQNAPSAIDRVWLLYWAEGLNLKACRALESLQCMLSAQAQAFLLAAPVYSIQAVPEF